MSLMKEINDEIKGTNRGTASAVAAQEPSLKSIIGKARNLTIDKK